MVYTAHQERKDELTNNTRLSQFRETKNTRKTTRDQDAYSKLKIDFTVSRSCINFWNTDAARLKGSSWILFDLVEYSKTYESAENWYAPTLT